MNSYTRLNNLTGWIAALIATFVYIQTAEPTASFWDCGEYIATAYTLGVPHAPGAPLYLLLGRLFSFLSYGDPLQVAYCLNVLSAICSGLTILFLFWSITLLGRKLLSVKKGAETSWEMAVLMGSGLIGSLAFAFTDSFWFSATEAEIYAMASLFSAFCFWAMLKWETLTDFAEAQRWLILIAYLIGLSVGVHILNLLVIPALAIIYYGKKYEHFNLKGILLAFVAGLGILGCVLYGLGFSGNIAAQLDIFLVNVVGLPIGSGLVLFCFLFFGALGYGIYDSQRKMKVALNIILLVIAFVFIGYASYFLIPIRASEDPAINLNDPNNIVSFIGYLNREQYPSRPLWYGPDFTAEIEGQEQGKAIYTPQGDQYIVKDHKLEYRYDAEAQTLLPRLYSQDPGHPALYRQWTDLKEGEKPTFLDNLTFLFRYQLGHMYWRYFLWNFAGRASDLQNADWLSPLEGWEKVPALLAQNKARNNYWMLPLLLGVGGLLFQYRKSKKDFTVLASLFFMTGIALVIYTNNPPAEPRERDYVYVSNFYTFSLWIGIGVMGISAMIAHWWKRHTWHQAVLASLGCLIVPVLLVTENWDDHDRSGRYFSVDAARNMLASCDPNAILFTGGDNDTYPLWYVQHVEGFRTDVRVLVTSFSNVDWYIEQMKRPLYDSAPVPLSLTMEHYRQGGLNDYIPYVQNSKIQGAINASQYLKLIQQNSPALQVRTQTGKINTIPAQSVYFNVDTSELIQNKIVPSGKEPGIHKRITWQLTGSGLEKKDLLLLDLVDTSRWTRPVYFNTTSLRSINLDISNFVVQEGDTFRLVPFENPDPEETLVDTEKMYERMMHQFAWRGLDNPDTYYHGYYLMYVQNQRMNFNILADALIKEAQFDKAKATLHKSLEVMPDDTLPYDVASIQTAGLWLELGEKSQADHIADTLTQRYDELLTYLADHENPLYQREQAIGLYAFNEFARYYQAAGYPEEADKYKALLAQHYDQLN